MINNRRIGRPTPPETPAPASSLPDQCLRAAKMPPLSINELPPAVLARIITVTHPRCDGLALLLTCRHWLAVAEAECPQHLWGVACLNHTNPRVQELLSGGALGKRALLAGFAKRGRVIRQLEVVVPAWTRVAHAPSATLVANIPGLLRDMPCNGRLRSLTLNCALSQRELAAACKAAAQLTLLQHLALDTMSPGTRLDVCPLGQLSCLVLLERLEFRTAADADHMPLDLLSALGRLTLLDLEAWMWGRGGSSTAWLRPPDGVGAALRVLRVKGYGVMGGPKGLVDLFPALHHLEKLSLQHMECTPALWDALPQLTGLTSLGIDRDYERRLWPVLARCGQLLELELDQVSLIRPLPPGSLQQLTRLGVGWWSSSLKEWRGLPSLRSLRLKNYDGGDNALPDLGHLYPLLEELELENFLLSNFVGAVAQLAQLTLLAGFCRGTGDHGAQALPPGPYLANLKELSFVLGPPSWGPIEFRAGGPPCWVLPDALSEATSLERLDLSGNLHLRLRGAEDAALLRRLPRLQRVKLPLPAEGGEEVAAAVKCIRRGLLGGVGAAPGEGPSHEVEVDIVRRG